VFNKRTHVTLRTIMGQLLMSFQWGPGPPVGCATVITCWTTNCCVIIFMIKLCII